MRAWGQHRLPTPVASGPVVPDVSSEEEEDLSSVSLEFPEPASPVPSTTVSAPVSSVTAVYAPVSSVLPVSSSVPSPSPSSSPIPSVSAIVPVSSCSSTSRNEDLCLSMPHESSVAGASSSRPACSSSCPRAVSSADYKKLIRLVK